MLHTLLIAAHAAAGVAALVIGLLALLPPREGIPATFRLYLGALWLMVLFLVAVVTLDWGTLTTMSRLLFGALVALAFYMAWRGLRGWLQLQQRGAGWQEAYTEDVGFTLIALFDGFVIVGALDLGAPVWLVVALGISGVLAGRAAISRTKARTAA